MLKASIGNGVAKELISMTHGMNKGWGDHQTGGSGECWVEWGKGGKTGTTVIAKSINNN